MGRETGKAVGGGGGGKATLTLHLWEAVCIQLLHVMCGGAAWEKSASVMTPLCFLINFLPKASDLLECCF